MSRDASTGAPAASAARLPSESSGCWSAGLFVLVFQQVLGITQRPSWPPPPEAVTPAGAEAATEAFAARDGTRPHDAALDFAWSTAATIEPLGRGQDLLPADLRRRRGRPLVGPHPHVRLAGGRGRDGDGRTARAEAGRRRRGACDRRRLRLEALRRGRARCSDGSRPPGRRSSSTTSSPSTATGCTRTTGGWTGARTRSAAPTTASSTSSTAPSPGPAARGSRTTSRTAASTT